MKNLYFILYLCLLFSCQIRDKQALKIEGHLMQWHKVSCLSMVQKPLNGKGKSFSRLQT